MRIVKLTDAVLEPWSKWEPSYFNGQPSGFRFRKRRLMVGLAEIAHILERSGGADSRYSVRILNTEIPRPHFYRFEAAWNHLMAALKPQGVQEWTVTSDENDRDDAEDPVSPPVEVKAAVSVCLRTLQNLLDKLS